MNQHSVCTTVDWVNQSCCQLWPKTGFEPRAAEWELKRDILTNAIFSSAVIHFVSQVKTSSGNIFEGFTMGWPLLGCNYIKMFQKRQTLAMDHLLFPSCACVAQPCHSSLISDCNQIKCRKGLWKWGFVAAMLKGQLKQCCTVQNSSSNVMVPQAFWQLHPIL